MSTVDESELIEVEVRCSGVSYFDSIEDTNANGTPKVNGLGHVIVINRRKEAAMGDIIKITPSEYERLIKEDAIQEPGSQMLANHPDFVPSATPFGIPANNTTDIPINPIGGDPRTAAAAATSTPLSEDEDTGKKGKKKKGKKSEKSVADDSVLNLSEDPVDKIAAWIIKDKVTVDQLIEYADGDPEIATKLSVAEQSLGNKARSTAIDRLDEIANGQSNEDDQ